MKRRQHDFSELDKDDDYSSLATKRVASLVDESASTDCTCLHQTALPNTLLSHLDGLTLSNITQKLTTFNINRLLQTGDRVLRAKLASHIRRLAYSRQELPVYVTSERQSSRVWLLPDILAHPMPLLTRLIIDRTRPLHLRCTFANLPPSITHLGLFGVTMNVFCAQDVVFKLPALVELHVSNITVYIIDRWNIGKHVARIGYPSKFVSDDEWLIDALRGSPALVNVSFTYSPSLKPIMSVSCYNAIVSLPLLEVLELKRFQINSDCWPRHLHTLELTGCGADDVYSIPDTVTDLHFSGYISNDVLASRLSMAPASLLHLRVNGKRLVFGDDLWLLIARFSRLQTLQIPCLWNVVGVPVSLGDLSLLPRTMKLMSTSFAAVPSQWYQLPVGVSFSELSYDVIIKRSDLPCYWEKNHAAYAPYFPKKLHRLCLRDSFLPAGVEGVRQLHVSLSSHVYNQHDSSLFLQNVPPTLVALSIDVMRPASLFSLANFCAPETFPLLAMLCLRVEEPSIPTAAVLEWLSNVPASIRDLRLDIAQAQSDLRPRVCLDDIVLPPKLIRLHLKLPNHVVTLPISLPNKMLNVDIECYDIYSSKSCDVIAAWPLLLMNVSIKIGDPSSVCAARCDVAKAELIGRIATFRGHKVIFRPFSPRAGVF